MKEIDWKFWKDTIQTEGLVDKVKTNFETLQKEQYNIDGIVNTVISAPSKELENIVSIPPQSPLILSSS